MTQVRLEFTSNINTNPSEFQFKSEYNSWTLDPNVPYDSKKAGKIIVWTNPEDGRLYLIDGHNRHFKAKQKGIKQQLVLDLSNKAETKSDVLMLAYIQTRGHHNDSLF